MLSVHSFAEASMRLLLSCLLAMGCLVRPIAASQARGRAASGPSTIRACALLTRELARKMTPYEGQALQFMLRSSPEPEEDTLGAGGSDCSDLGIAVQIDPRFSFEVFRRQKDWEQAEHVAGLGDDAFFHDNIGEWAELIVRSGPHLLTIRMNVPPGKTAASIKPNVVALAKALLPNLK
jgi:hypothetical protein